jgi:glycosyltransferase involved in cell wall biosynthesis
VKVGLSACVIQRGKTGVAQYVFALLQTMIERPECPQFVVYALEDDAPLFNFAHGRVQIHRVPERFRPPIKSILWHQRTLPQLAREARLDVLHIPSYRRLLWPKPCPLVATIHDLAPFHVPGKYDPLRMLYGRIVVRRLAHRQDRIVAVSHDTARDIQQFFGIQQHRIEVVHNGLDHGRFRPGDPEMARAAAEARWELRHPFFLYVSRLEHPGKNHVRLIEAFTRFKAATGSNWLLALGGSDWHGADAIRAAAQSSGARSDIRFLGFVPDAELPELYRAASAVVYPSLFEGFGFPPVEAMACGCPVLSSARGALREVVGNAAGIVDPEDVDDLERKLTRMAGDPAWRDQLRSAGFKNAQRFSWQATAAAVLDCYKSVRRGQSTLDLAGAASRDRVEA